MHTEVRRMSRGRSLKCFFALHTDIPAFLTQHSKWYKVKFLLQETQGYRFSPRRAFLVDITSNLNALNMQLQGPNCVESLRPYEHIQCKLALFKGFTSAPPNLVHVPACEEMSKDVPECEKTFHKYGVDVETLTQQLKWLFSRFPRHEATNSVIHKPPLCYRQREAWTAVGPLLSSIAQEEGNFLLDTSTSVLLSTPEGLCTLNGQHVWKQLRLWEQLLDTEAQQVKREKRADARNSVPAHADWMRKHWHSVDPALAGEATSESLRQVFTHWPVG